MNWTAVIKRGKFSNYKNALSLSGDYEEKQRAGDYARDACRLRHPATPACGPMFCSKLIAEDVSKNLPQAFSKSLIMSRIEFLMSMLGVQFVVVNNVYDGTRQLRILSTTFKRPLPLLSTGCGSSGDIEHVFGQDITEDLLGAFQAYTRSSYYDVKSDSNFNFQKDQLVKSKFFDSADFDYFVGLGFVVDVVADDAIFGSLEHDKNVPDGVLDRGPIAVAALNKPTSRNDMGLVRLDWQLSRLLKSIERLAAYRDVSEGCHFGALCLLRKFLNTWMNEERARIVKSLELTAAEKEVLATEQNGERETPDQRSSRIALLQMHERIKQTALANYSSYAHTLLKKLSNVYMEFMSTAGGVSTRRRIDYILKFAETRSDEFLQVRKKQFQYLLNHTERPERFDFSIYMRKFPSCVSARYRQFAN